MARNSPNRKPRKGEVIALTGLAAKLERAGRSGLIPKVTTLREPEPEYERADELPTEDEWQEELPPANPADVASALGSSLSAHEAQEPDLDRLWDWIRADEDKGKRFLGETPKTSADMRRLCTQFQDLYALTDAAADGDSHIGFAGFQMLPNHAVTHLYLAPTARGDGPRLIPQLMEMAEAQYPDVVFVVHTGDAAMARMLRGVGFEAGFLLKWTPKPSRVPVADAQEIEQE